MRGYLEHLSRQFLCRPSGFIGSLFKKGLSLLSSCFERVIALRNKAYDQQLFSQHNFPDLYVISVGNIQVGGTGKTPFTLLLAKSLSAYLQTAILSRGYRSLGRFETVSINDSLGPRFSASFCGDEAYLLASRLPDVQVIVGKNRVEAARQAIDQGAQLVILDDGFQHRRLGRNLDVVLIDSSMPSEAFHLLPRGLLRERFSSLRRAHLIVLTHMKQPDPPEDLKKLIRKYTNAPIIGGKLKVAEICATCVTVASNIVGQKAALFCGIANPSSFLATVEELGASVVSQHYFADHALYTYDHLVEFAIQARQKGAQFLICTEKDAVKIFPWIDQLPLPVVWLQMDMAISFGQADWEYWIQSIISKKVL